MRHFFLQRVNVTRYKLLHHFRGILELSLVIIIIIKFSFIYIYILFYKTKYPFFQNQNNQSLLIQLNKMEIIINKNIKRSKQKLKSTTYYLLEIFYSYLFGKLTIDFAECLFNPKLLIDLLELNTGPLS